MNTLPTAYGVWVNGSSSCGPYTVIQSSKGWVTSASHSAAHQRLMMANLAASLFAAEGIVTTEAKAKALRPIAEKLITKAKKAQEGEPLRIHRIRQIQGYLGDKEMTAKLVGDVAPRYMDRNGGYLRILKLGPRQGDNAQMARIELRAVTAPDGQPLETALRIRPPAIASATHEPARARRTAAGSCMNVKRIERFTKQLIPVTTIEGFEPKRTAPPRSAARPGGWKPGDNRGGKPGQRSFSKPGAPRKEGGGYPREGGSGGYPREGASTGGGFNREGGGYKGSNPRSTDGARRSYGD
eukprot:gene17491-35992_t